MFARAFRAVDRVAAAAMSRMRIGWLQACYPGLSIGPGTVLRRGVRIKVLNGATLRIGDRVTIESCAELHSDGEIVIGNDAFIGMGTMIAAAERIAIGNDVLIGEHVTVRDQDHQTRTKGLPFRLQGKVSAPVLIGDNVWLGAGAVILKGVSIGHHSVVGARAVVTQSLADGSRVVGVPARPIA